MGYDFDELRESSVFNLIMSGDVEFSYRFNEAVCSGGVPVLISERWVAPFNEIIPFETYGVSLAEHDVRNLSATLKAIPKEKVRELRREARRACAKAFVTPKASILALLEFLTVTTDELPARNETARQ